MSRTMIAAAVVNVVPCRPGQELIGGPVKQTIAVRVSSTSISRRRGLPRPDRGRAGSAVTPSPRATVCSCRGRGLDRSEGLAAKLGTPGIHRLVTPPSVLGAGGGTCYQRRRLGVQIFAFLDSHLGQ
jgi:hypothetical protein